MPATVQFIGTVVNFFIGVFGRLGFSFKAALALSYVATAGTFYAIGSLIKSQIPTIGLGETAGAVLSNSRSNTAPLPVIYGVRRVGGVMVFMSASDGYTQEGEVTDEFPNEYLNLVIALCEGPISAVEKVYANNVEIWPQLDPRFQNKVFVNVHLGERNQAVDQELKAVAESDSSTFAWGDDHRLRGIAYLYVRLEADEEVWGAGMPTINADVKGRMVEDTRNTYAGTAYSINRFSNNPALCIRDYLMNSTYGRGISGSQISDSSFEAAANYCDEKITYTLSTGHQETQKRYTLNGVVTIGESSLDILNKLLTSCRGMLVFSGGVYKLILDKAETPSLTFDESNIMTNYDITLPGKNTLTNRISANYFNPAKEWQSDFEYVESSAYKLADNNLLMEAKIELPFTADRLMSFYIAEQTMKQTRQGILIEFSTFQEGLLAEVGDVIYIKLDAPGWSSLNSGSGKLFRVISVTIESTDEVSIIAREYDSGVYDHGTASAIDTSPNTDLPSMGSVNAPTSLTATESLMFNDPRVTNRVSLDWESAKSSYVTKYEIAYMSGTPGGTYIQAGTVTGKQFTIDNLDPGVYYFSVKAVNSAGFSSDYATTEIRVKGKSILPSVNPPGITGITESLVSSTAGSGIKAKAVLSWVAVANSDWEALGVTIENYEVGFKLAGTTNPYQIAGLSTGTFFEFFDITPGNYEFIVRAINDAGIKSIYAESTAEITGLSAAPTDVANFYLRAESTQANLSWTPSPDIDVKVGGTFEIRHSVATSGATWGSSIKVGSDIAGSSNSASMPLLVGTYLIKAVDSTNNKSTNAKSIVNTVSPSIFDKRTAATVTDTTFAGTKSNMVIDSDTGRLKFEADTPWDSVAGNIDTWGLIDSVGGADLSGYYEFTNKIDLGAVANATLSSSIIFTTVSTTDIWDNFLQNIDDWEAVDANTFDDVNATMFISSTNDDPASGSATWSSYQEFTIGNYVGRGFKFKVNCTSEDATHQINISSLTAKAEVYYRFESETGTTNSAGTAFTYGSAFLSTPQIAITANDMATGDYYAITSSSATGFTLRFYNSGGTGISRTAYYLARGY